MSNSLKNIALAFAAITIVIIMAAMMLDMTAASGTERSILVNQCVFIDHHVHRDGALLEGQGIGLMIDFPTYGFNKEERKLTGMVNFAINDSLVAVYGDGGSLSGAMGGGAATMLYGVYTLPYDGRGLTIGSIDHTGAVTILYKNESIVLQPGEEWVRITSEIITDNGYDGNLTRINATTTDKIVNYGLINKADIVKH